MQDRKIFPLSSLTKAIENVINTHCNRTVWVKAEIVKLNHYAHSGHAYPDLVEKKDGRIIAELRGNIWKARFDLINQKFKDVLQEELKDDMSVVVQAQVTYHPVYGLALNITDIDPEYTLGELARQRAETIKRLKKEQLFTANKQKKLPRLPKTIAVISVETSKGYQDFLNVIANNEWGYKYHLKLFPAILQGERAVGTIMGQLEAIKQHLEVFDAVAIIRGGGGEIGLSCYDDYQLARSIASFPLPVLTGIGHSTNETVSELVSFKSFITPTKIAEFLLQEFHNFALPIREGIERLRQGLRRRFEKQHDSLKETARLFHSFTRWSLDRNRNQLEQLRVALQHQSRSLLEREHSNLKNLSTSLHFLSPETILKKGYSISRINGKLVQELDEIKEGEQLETYFHGGKISSRVEKLEPAPKEQDQLETENPQQNI